MSLHMAARMKGVKTPRLLRRALGIFLLLFLLQTFGRSLHSAKPSVCGESGCLFYSPKFKICSSSKQDKIGKQVVSKSLILDKGYKLI